MEMKLILNSCMYITSGITRLYYHSRFNKYWLILQVCVLWVLWFKALLFRFQLCELGFYFQTFKPELDNQLVFFSALTLLVRSLVCWQWCWCCWWWWWLLWWCYSGSNRLPTGGWATQAGWSVPTDVAEKARQTLPKPTGVLQQDSWWPRHQRQGCRGLYKLAVVTWSRWCLYNADELFAVKRDLWVTYPLHL